MCVFFVVGICCLKREWGARAGGCVAFGVVRHLAAAVVKIRKGERNCSRCFVFSLVFFYFVLDIIVLPGTLSVEQVANWRVLKDF